MVNGVWSDDVDELLGADLAVGLAYLTPARGVVITPMAPMGLRDRNAGTVTLTTSLALWKKLARIRKRSGVALAYHARDYGFSDRPGFVLVQGRASFSSEPDRVWLESITPQWERFLGPRRTGLAGRMLDVYYWQRVAVTVHVERVVAWPNDLATGDSQVHGLPRADTPAPQNPPGNGTAPRVATSKVAAHVGRLPHTLLGWCGADDIPEIAPVAGATETVDGLELDVAPGVLPQGGRRAGLTAHWFQPRMIGQEQRIHTGWLEVDGNRARYSPHTKAGYRLPPSKAAFVLGSASLATRMRAARRAGIAN